jgi:transposase/transposase IS116/IS110/IS902 family protein
VGSRARVERQYREDQAGVRPSTLVGKEPMMSESYSFFVGIDWGTQKHAICVANDQGKRLKEVEVEHSGAGLECLRRTLAELSPGHPEKVAVSIEVPRGAIVETLVERGFHVFSLNPKQLDPPGVVSEGPEAKDASEQQHEHPDAKILQSLPGVGTLVAATMLAEAAEPIAHRDYRTLRAICGQAPP